MSNSVIQQRLEGLFATLVNHTLHTMTERNILRLNLLQLKMVMLTGWDLKVGQQRCKRPHCRLGNNTLHTMTERNILHSNLSQTKVTSCSPAGISKSVSSALKASLAASLVAYTMGLAGCSFTLGAAAAAAAAAGCSLACTKVQQDTAGSEDARTGKTTSSNRIGLTRRLVVVERDKEQLQLKGKQAWGRESLQPAHIT
jgi:hypothetical protein